MTSVGSNIENQLVTFLVFLLLKYRQFYGRKANEAGHVARMEEGFVNFRLNFVLFKICCLNVFLLGIVTLSFNIT